jgi:predicted DNA-binding transcriptional regulator YafY
VWGADVAAEQPLLGPIYGALLDRRAIAFDYRRPDGESSTRHLETYGLVHRRGNWYVVGRDIDRDAIRSFKLTRIRAGIESIGSVYMIPQGFDASEYVAGEAFEIGGGPQKTAVIRFAPSLRWWAEQSWPDAARSETPDGGLEVEIPVSNVDALVSWVVGFGDEVEIVRPESARAAMISHLQPFLDGAR